MFQIQHLDHRIILTVKTDLSQSNALEFDEYIFNLCQKVPEEGSLIVDLSRCKYITSGPLGILIKAYKVLEEKDADLLLVVKSDAIYKLLEESQIDNIIPIYYTLDDALAQ